MFFQRIKNIFQQTIADLKYPGIKKYFYLSLLFTFILTGIFTYLFYAFVLVYLSGLSGLASDISFIDVLINSIIFKNESRLFKKIDINKYEDEILPLKNHLTLITYDNQKMIQKCILIFLSILAVIHHKLSLRIISKFFLPYDEIEFRIKLNNLLSEQIF